MDALAALRLQLEWGCDEALGPAPMNRLRRTDPVELATEVAPAAMTPAPSGRHASAAQEALPEPVARARAAAAAADSIEALRAALAAFDPAGLAATATSMVFADGHGASGLVLVGDVPGADEDRTGVPFSGRAGDLLDRMLASIGLDRTQALLTTVMPWRPPGGRPASELELACYYPFLLRHLALRQPRLVVLLGATAAWALLGRTASLSRLRGKWAEIAVPGLHAPLRVLPTHHPEQLLTRPELKAAVWADLRLLRRTLSEHRNG